jgi:hypothetical protein
MSTDELSEMQLALARLKQGKKSAGAPLPIHPNLRPPPAAGYEVSNIEELKEMMLDGFAIKHVDDINLQGNPK